MRRSWEDSDARTVLVGGYVQFFGAFGVCALKTSKNVENHVPRKNTFAISNFSAMFAVL